MRYELVERGRALRRAAQEPDRPPAPAPARSVQANLLALQRTAGNQAVNAVLGAPVVQRRLDQTTYSSNAFAGANLEGGFRLIGKSKFSQLTDALDAYHATTTQAEELAALNDLEAACDAWLNSSFRAKKHSKSKKDEEANKKTQVDALKLAVQGEIRTISENVDPATFDTMAPDARLNAAAATLARHLGLDVPGLAALSGDALTALYLDRIYAKVQMDRKAERDTGATGKVNDVIVKLLAADATVLPDGDVKTIVTTIQTARLGDRIAMNSKRAGKYSVGGTDSETLQPGVEGWSNGNQVKIDGNTDFRAKVKQLLDVIAQTDVGAALLGAIGGATTGEGAVEGGHTDVKKTVLEIVPPSVSSAQRVEDDGTMMYSNSAAGTKVAIDPDNDIVGKSAKKAAKEPWRVRDGAVGLFHEMVHIYIKKVGGETFEQDGERMQISDQGDLAELRIVGIAYEKDKADGTGKVTFPFDDPGFNPFTENAFRKQFAALKGETEFYLRPTYAKVVGQVPLPLDEQPV